MYYGLLEKLLLSLQTLKQFMEPWNLAQEQELKWYTPY
jgi:hypothetical protein